MSGHKHYQTEPDDPSNELDWTEIHAEMEAQREQAKTKPCEHCGTVSPIGYPCKKCGQHVSTLSQEEVDSLLKGIAGGDSDEDFDLPDMDDPWDAETNGAIWNIRAMKDRLVAIEKEKQDLIRRLDQIRIEAKP